MDQDEARIRNNLEITLKTAWYKTSNTEGLQILVEYLTISLYFLRAFPTYPGYKVTP